MVQIYLNDYRKLNFECAQKPNAGSIRSQTHANQLLSNISYILSTIEMAFSHRHQQNLLNKSEMKKRKKIYRKNNKHGKESRPREFYGNWRPYGKRVFYCNEFLFSRNKKKTNKLCANLPSFKINRTAHRSQIDSINPKLKRNVLHLNWYVCVWVSACEMCIFIGMCTLLRYHHIIQHVVRNAIEICGCISAYTPIFAFIIRFAIVEKTKQNKTEQNWIRIITKCQLV